MHSSFLLVLSILAPILAGLALLAAVVLGAIFGLVSLLASTSGLKALAARYPASGEPPEPLQRRQTVMLGAVRYRFCVDVAPTHQGLYLHVRPPLGRSTALLIPWGELGAPRETTIYWQKAWRLPVGQPTVAHLGVMAPLYATLALYLEDARAA